MEYTEKRWRCDQCDRHVKRGVMPPSGWQEVVIDFYGNTMHCCPDPACHEKTIAWLLENYPSAAPQITDGSRRSESPNA